MIYTSLRRSAPSVLGTASLTSCTFPVSSSAPDILRISLRLYPENAIYKLLRSILKLDPATKGVVAGTPARSGLAVTQFPVSTPFKLMNENQ